MAVEGLRLWKEIWYRMDGKSAILGVSNEEGSNSFNNEKGMDKTGIGGIKEKESIGPEDLLHLGSVASESREERRGV